MTVTVNSNASGSWSGREGMELEYVGPGHNPLNAEVRRPGQKRTFFLPTRWLDGIEREPELKAEVKAVIGTAYCPHCGQLMPKEGT